MVAVPVTPKRLRRVADVEVIDGKVGRSTRDSKEIEADRLVILTLTHGKSQYP